MGMTEISVWALIRRYDKLVAENDIVQSKLQCFTILPGLTLEELRLSVRCWTGIEHDDHKVLKIRRHDNNLIPLSSLLEGSQKDKPFILDVVNVHQFCPIENRIIPPGYTDALGLQLDKLEKRISMAEACLPDTTSFHIHTVESTARQLVNRVSFLDRRLSELIPQKWKEQVGSQSATQHSVS